MEEQELAEARPKSETAQSGQVTARADVDPGRRGIMTQCPGTWGCGVPAAGVHCCTGPRVPFVQAFVPGASSSIVVCAFVTLSFVLLRFTRNGRGFECWSLLTLLAHFSDKWNRSSPAPALGCSLE